MAWCRPLEVRLEKPFVIGGCKEGESRQVSIRTCNALIHGIVAAPCFTRVRCFRIRVILRYREISLW